MHIMLNRILIPPKQSFFLLGPRGSGKSTWLRNNFPEAHVIDLLSEEIYQHLLISPGHLADQLRTVPSDQWVIIDEIQRLPGLLNEVHRFIENKRLKFALCGSSARKLKKEGVNLLAGRAFQRAMHPFVPEELGEHFDIEDALQFGLLPIVFESSDKKNTISAYSQLYLKEEIQAEALVRNLPGFARFLPIAAMCHGQTVNVSNIARESEVARTTITGYLDILVDTLLCFRLPAYEAKLRLRERKHPKWYWCDPGIVRAMKKSTGRLAPEERGALFEGMVAQLLRAYKDYRSSFDEMYYWAPSSGTKTEIDFLLLKEDQFIAIEAKSGKSFSQYWCKGLRAIVELKGVQRRIIVYPDGPVMRTEDGIDVIPFRTFADQLSKGIFL